MNRGRNLDYSSGLVLAPPSSNKKIVFSESVFNHAILVRYSFEKPVSNTLGTCKMKRLCSFAGLNTMTVKTIFVDPNQNTLQTRCLKTQRLRCNFRSFNHKYWKSLYVCDLNMTLSSKPAIPGVSASSISLSISLLMSSASPLINITVSLQHRNNELRYGLFNQTHWKSLYDYSFIKFNMSTFVLMGTLGDSLKTQKSSFKTILSNEACDKTSPIIFCVILYITLLMSSVSLFIVMASLHIRILCFTLPFDQTHKKHLFDSDFNKA